MCEAAAMCTAKFYAIRGVLACLRACGEGCAGAHSVMPVAHSWPNGCVVGGGVLDEVLSGYEPQDSGRSKCHLQW
jgi:hypothetical protein